MKKLITAALTLAFVFALTTSAVADEKKAKVRALKGELLCAHCDLSIGDSCSGALRVTAKGKEGKEIKRIFLLKGDAASSLGKGKGQMVIAKGTIKTEGKGKNIKRIMTVASLKLAPAKK